MSSKTAATSSGSNSLLKKEINLLKDTHRKIERRQQLAVVYRGCAIVFVFGAVLLSAVWGWTEYEIGRVNAIKVELDNKEYELLQFKDTIDKVNAYKDRLYQIKDVGLGKDSEVLVAYRDLVELEREGQIRLTKFEVSGIKFKASYEISDLAMLKSLSETFESEEMKSKWRNIVVNQVSRQVQMMILLEVSGDLVVNRT